MAKTPTRRLKVFQAQFGFYDTVVAAPSRAAALRAWGTHQDLFATGQARQIDDIDAVAAAQAHPERPLRRAVGSNAPFALQPTSLPEVPVIERSAARKPAEKAAKPSPPPRPEADRGELDAAEAALKAVDEARKREESAFRRRQEALDAEREAAQAVYVATRKAASATVVAARQAYRRAGGSR